MTTKPALQNTVKEILQTDENDKHIQEATELKKKKSRTLVKTTEGQENTKHCKIYKMTEIDTNFSRITQNIHWLPNGIDTGW